MQRTIHLPRRGTRTLIVTLVAVAALLAVWALRPSTGAPHHASASAAAPANQPAADGTATVAQPQLTAAQLAQWKRQTATTAGRAAVVAGFRKVLGAHARIGFGPLPSGTTTVGAVRQASYQDLSSGISGNHFWFIITDYEVHQGLGWGLKAACFWALPLAGALICGSIITAIEGASYGTGRNHGVWGAVYWAPPHITIGRW